MEKNKGVLSAPEISLDAPIEIESESVANKQFLLVDKDAQRIGGRFLNWHSIVYAKHFLLYTIFVELLGRSILILTAFSDLKILQVLMRNSFYFKSKHECYVLPPY